MGSVISFIMIILGAFYYFSIRLSKNKRSLEEDDIAGGAAWIVVLTINIFISIVIVSYIGPYLFLLEQPWRIISQITIGIIFVYVSYKVTCVPVPTKE